MPVSYDELSPYLIDALIATEDERFYKHSGIDLEALGRVFFKTALLGNRSTGGGSTISQQLAKLLFTGRRASGMRKVVVQKLKEWIIAVRLERRYTKEEIITMYLNRFDFLNDGDGIKAASEIYFGKSQDSLSLSEAATLVGMLKNPSLFNPVRFPDTVKHRRMVVLKQMEKNNLIGRELYDSLRVAPLDMSNFKRSTHNDGLAPYFRGELVKEVNRILAMEDNLKADGSTYNIYRDGLKVYTTIDPLIQSHMEEAAKAHMKKLQETFNKHWKKLDPWTFKTHETTANEMAARERKLQRMIRESDRYQQLRSRYLSNVLQNIKTEVTDFRVRDVDIDRMLSEEEKAGSIARLVKSSMISDNMAAEYQEIMESGYWTQLKGQWEKLQEAAEAMFDEPVEMRVFTFENSRMEKDTLMSPLDSLKYHHHFLQIGSMAVDPLTGHVKGWVGGINYKYFKYDHVGSRRQVGSTFKPFVYATAIEQQSISPCFVVYDLPQTILPGDGNFQLADEWTPSNSDGKYSGEPLTLKEGLRKSKNTISVWLMKQLRDTDPVLDLVDNMGIDKDAKYANGRFVVPRAPSICLGATDLSVEEMTGAYTTFANNGIYNKPRFISRIEDRNGRPIFVDLPEERQALDERPNYVMVEMLKYAATGLWELKSEVGGKTGTTNDYVDGWFMGITPSLVVGTWVGGEDRWIRFRSIVHGQGAVMAKPFFKDFMKRLEADEDADYDIKARFSIPQGDLGIELDCTKYENPDDPTDQDSEYDLFEEDMFGDEDFPPLDSTRINN